MRVRRVLLVASAVLASTSVAVLARSADETVATTPPTAPLAAESPSTTSTTAPATTTTTAPAPTTSLTTTTTAAARRVGEPAWAPFATAGPLTLHHPAALVERVAFHQSNHEGAQHLETSPTAFAPTVLEARERLTDAQTAADIVVAPGTEIRSPVTGRVKRAGTYTLYCKHRDDYVVIAPDAHPAWEVKLLHIDGVTVRSGQRVTAGVTVLAPQATPLPFESQVDRLRTADPAWPHVHVEVVDPAIRNVPSPGGGC